LVKVRSITDISGETPFALPLMGGLAFVWVAAVVTFTAACWQAARSWSELVLLRPRSPRTVHWESQYECEDQFPVASLALLSLPLWHN